EQQAVRRPLLDRRGGCDLPDGSAALVGGGRGRARPHRRVRLRLHRAVVPARHAHRLPVEIPGLTRPFVGPGSGRYGDQQRRARGADRHPSFGEVRMMARGSSGSVAPAHPPFWVIVSITLTGIMANTVVTAAVPDI